MTYNLFPPEDKTEIPVDCSLYSLSLSCNYPNVLRVTISNETWNAITWSISYAKAVHDKLRAHNIEPKHPVTFKIESVNFHADFVQVLSINGEDGTEVEEKTESPLLVVDVGGSFRFTVTWGDLDDVLKTKKYDNILDLYALF